MDYSQYETYPFDSVSAFNMSTGFRRRNYQRHWHSYGEILLCKFAFVVFVELSIVLLKKIIISFFVKLYIIF